MKHIDVGRTRGDLGDVTLTSGISISGKVLNAVGEPLEGIWVNLTESQTKGKASYEAKRSSKTGREGDFQTRPLRPGNYEVMVETKATGALEKEKYANFHDTPPPAVFARQRIDVTEASLNKPFVIQAVPHIYIKGQCYNPKGEITSCHFPRLMGRFKGQSMWIHAKKGEQVGEFELMVPHGVESARLTFSTNEHTGLTIQFAGKEPSPQRAYRYDTIEEDISDIKVVRYVAPIVQVKVVDESGKQVTDVRVSAEYQRDRQVAKEMMQESPIVKGFEKQDDGIFRSSSLVPDIEFVISAKKNGFESERIRMTMKEGTNDTITIELGVARR